MYKGDKGYELVRNVTTNFLGMYYSSSWCTHYLSCYVYQE